MKKRKKSVERRKHQRFNVQHDAFAIVSPLSIKRGEIIDIGKGGLSLRCVAGEVRPRSFVQANTFLHIFSNDFNACLFRIPIREISDIETDAQDPSNPATRRRVQFGELTDNQIMELDDFIRDHTTCEE